LTPFRAGTQDGTPAAKPLQRLGSVGGSAGTGGMGGYGPMAGAHGRGDNSREHESTIPAAALDGGGEPGAGPSSLGGAWLPATAQSDAPFAVTNVSWGASTSALDQLAVPDASEPPGFADGPQPTLEQVSDRWVSPPVIGVDKELTL
jgi:hypothetical protein